MPAMSAAESPSTAVQAWERTIRGDLEGTLQEALRSLRSSLESRLQQELNAGLANAFHDAAPALQQALQRRVRGWAVQMPPPPPALDPWPNWLAGLLDAEQPPQLLQALFAAANSLVARLAIFVIRGGAAVSWRGAGFDSPVRVALEGGRDAFAMAANEARSFTWRAERPLRENLPAGFAPSIAGGLHPLLVRGKTIALLYYEGGPELADQQLEPRLAVLLRVAGLALDRIMRQTGRSAEETPAPISAARLRAAVQNTAPADAPVAPSASRPVTSTEARALRFAKVLLQDLELYLKRDRPQELAEARAQRDVYQRLHADLEKCRQSFQEKFPAGSGVSLDILERQIIEILCQGDRGMMGAAYAGLQ